MARKLKDIGFSDLYLTRHRCWLTLSQPDKTNPVELPSEFRLELNEMITVCDDVEKSTRTKDFAIIHDGCRYRVSVMPSLSEKVFVLRKFPTAIPPISKLGINKEFVNKLLKPHLAGLVLISGATGSGKTWTASSLAKEVLMRHGGVGVTIEDPPEMPLEGIHGPGICYQTWASRESGGFAEAARSVMRWAPSVIFIGEIRDSEVACEALRSSVNGHLVISTIHADGVVKTITRIVALARSGDIGSDAANLCSDGLVAVHHQKLVQESRGKAKVLKSQFLFLGDRDSYAAKAIIRSGKFETLSSEIQRQMTSMGEKFEPPERDSDDDDEKDSGDKKKGGLFGGKK